LANEEQEQLAADLEEQLKKLKVSDVLVQTILTVGSLGFARLEGELAQAKLAIEALKALVPTLEGEVSAEVIRDFNQLVANLQLGYAKAVSGAG
jgi:hypothetical protein